MAESKELLFYLLPLLFVSLLLVKIIKSDLKNFKIRNIDVFVLFSGGLIYCASAPVGAGVLEWQLPGSAGLKNHSISFLITLLLGFLLFALKLWGAGDAKLVAALAIWIPYQQVPSLLLYIMVVGGFVAITRVLIKGNGKTVLKNIQSIVLFRLAGLSTANSFETAERIPFSIAIAGGWTALAVTKFLGI
jgi:Flp pilus assembly protein protease CpaA